MNDDPRRRLELCATPPDDAVPDDDTIAVVTKLLGPITERFGDQLAALLGFDEAAVVQVGELETDPRFLLGRLAQAQAMLATALTMPALGTIAQMLFEALEDAADHQMALANACRCEEGSDCPKCVASGRRAELYSGLQAQLGLVATRPVPLEAVE